MTSAHRQLGGAGARPTPSERKHSLRELHRAFAAEALRRTGKTQKGLAEAAGFDRTVLSRLFSDKHDNNLSPIVIAKICELTGQTPPGPEFSPAGPIGGDAVRGASIRRELPDALPYAANDDLDLERVVRAIVSGRNECDPWLIASDDLWTVGLRRGDVVVVDRAARAVDGDLVLAQLYNWDGTWAGSVLRVMDRGRLLLPWTGPTTPPPIDLSSNVAVMGPVTQSFRPRRWSQVHDGEA